MPCPLPSTNRTLGFGSSKLSPCLIDNACALDDHSKVAQTALQHPVPNFRDGFGYIGKKGKLVDKDSLLRNGTLLTQTGGKMLLPNPGFLTVPYMGYGRNNACTANVVFESKGTSVSKSCLPNSGRPAFTPLIGCLADQIQNTDHIIQEDVNKNWIRGGYPSRKCLQSCKK
jgi:hypothetical protein|tara:strand:- start:12648 stop:13160 length:513 start_codon:yes stop_codon:yes gene_type:complete